RGIGRGTGGSPLFHGKDDRWIQTGKHLLFCSCATLRWCARESRFSRSALSRLPKGRALLCWGRTVPVNRRSSSSSHVRCFRCIETSRLCVSREILAPCFPK